MMRHLVNSLLALSGLVLTVTLIAKFMPEGATPLQEWEEDALGPREECTVLFIGPSYVKQVDPVHFDAEAKRLGTNDRACKLGRTMLKGVELEHELDVLLSSDWPKLQFVVVDITLGDKLAFEEDNWFKSRVIGWHTYDSVKSLGRYYKFNRKSLSKEAPLFWSHAKHFAANLLEIGKGATLLGALTTFREELNRGRLPRISQTEYKQRFKRLTKAREAMKRRPTYDNSDWPLALRKRIRARGYEAAFLIAPVWSVKPVPQRAVVGKDRLQVMDFADPLTYPELYTYAARGSTNHLSAEGNVPYSKRLAFAVSQLKGRQQRKATRKAKAK